MSRLVLQRADVHGRAGGLADITIIGGRIESIVPSAGADPDPGSGSGSDSDASSTGREAIDVIDVVGRVVLPAFVEPHLHLDKAFLPFPSGDTSLADAIAHTAAQKAAFTRDGIRSRALMLVSAALANGTTRVRAQTEVDPTVGLLGVETITELADELSGVMTLQLAVFPQEGIICRPGTLDLMQIALESPGSVVGGCPYVERTPAEAREHVDLVLDLAERTGRLADLHLDFADDARDERFSLATYVAQATIDRGLHGRVAIGHVTSLGSLAAPQLAPVLELLAEARITVIVLPATDLYLGGRSDTVNQRRGLAPLASLWSAGVQVALASNNVQNAFTPTGTADLLDIALLAARVGQVSSPDQFSLLVDAITVRGAAVLDPGLEYGIHVGGQADIVVLDTVRPGSIITDQPGRHVVISRGRVVYREERNATFVGEALALGRHHRR